ncbi:MAG: hypothetical protein FWG78_01695 [Coriobacteriia bacterium]|nr:hypothetical protein [Coriobacteriia bacterium]
MMLLLLLGTFAWGAIQRGLNQFANNTVPAAVLIDEFARKDERTWDKLVRVDNLGITPFIARISAAEFMQFIYGTEWADGRNIISDITTFAPLIPSAEATMTATLEAPFGSAIDTQTAWFAVTDDMWSIRGLTNLTSLAQAAPLRGHDADGMPFAEYWDWTQPHAMTYAQWTAAPVSQRSNKWVLADDGFFYYTSVIRPGDTNNTSLPLLTTISAQPGFDPVQGAFYYAIDLQMEVVSRDDFSRMRDGGMPSFGTDGVPLRAASIEGKEILDAINWDPTPIIFGMTINDNDVRSITIPYNTLVTLKVDAGDDPNLTYRWEQRINGVWSPASGTNNETEYTVNTARPNAFEFQVLVSNSGGAPVEGTDHTAASDMITVTIPGIGGTPITIGSPRRILIDGVPFWRIASDGPYDLIVTQHIYRTDPHLAFTGTDTGPRFNATTTNANFWLANTGTGSAPTNVSNMQQGMDTWWNNMTPMFYPDLNAFAVQANFGNEDGIITGVVTTRNFGIETDVNPLNALSPANVNFTSFPQAQSRPSGVFAGTTTTSTTAGTGIVAFSLSGTEILRYFPNTGTANITSDAQLAPRAYGVAAGGNHQTAESTTTRFWHMRSRGQTSGYSGYVLSSGDIRCSWGQLSATGVWGNPAGNSVTQTDVGLRPALWVRR